jgi:hypothetical protein
VAPAVSERDMVKNHWVCASILFGVVGCSADDGRSSGGASGGAPGFGGAPATGAVAASGGGATPSGGAPANGGASSGGTSSGGGVASGGGPASGGTAASGGSTAVTGGTGGQGSAGASAGGAATGGAGGTPPPACTSTAPDEFEGNDKVGGGGAVYEDSPHFRVYGSASASAIDSALKNSEAAYSCFVEDWCFRSVGLPVKGDASGPYYKMNIYAVGSLGSAAGVTQWDASAGLSYLQVISSQMALPRVTVHEFGHSLALSEYNWVDQTRTGAWWETMANWVADSYLTSPYCEPARNRSGIAEGTTIIDLDRVIGQSYLLIVSTQNYYEAWPFLTYLTNNPDAYPGLGKMAVADLMRQHPRNNDTPLHVLEKIATPVKVQTILGRYWARMAYLDIGHAQAQKAFFAKRGALDFANVDSTGSGTYRVKSARRPQYGGANIVPLTGTGAVTVQVKNLGNGLSESNFTATLSIRASSGAVRYVDLPGGSGSATVASGEEASLVVANTPDTLYQYDAFKTTASSPESAGLNYQVELTGAAPAN